MDKTNDSLLFLAKYINQLETDIERCSIPPLVKKFSKKLVGNLEEGDQENVEGEEEEDNVPVLNKELAVLKPFQETEEIYSPQLCTWDFMVKEDLENLLKITNRSKIKEKLEERMGKFPLGFSKIIAIEFLMDATNFCRRSTFNLEQSGSIMSILYWTHKFFTMNLFVCPEDVYSYFREFLTFHTLHFPPTHFKIFTLEEAEVVLMFFCRLYLRHLPLVRMLTLPNFGFELEYVLEPEMKQDKSKKGKKDKGGKKDKVGKKKK